MLRRRKVMKKSMTEERRAQLRELFDVIDTDGGGEVEYDEFAHAWSMMAGRNAASMKAAKELFNGIDVDKSGTMDFEEFARLMNELEETDANSSLVASATDARSTMGTMFRLASEALRTRKVIIDFENRWGGE